MHIRILAFLAFLWSSQASGLTLEECFQSAKKHNPRFEVFKLEKQQHSLRKAIASLSFIPDAYVSKSLKSSQAEALAKNSGQNSLKYKSLNDEEKNLKIRAKGKISLSTMAAIALKIAESEIRNHQALQKAQELLFEGITLYLDLYAAQLALKAALSNLEFTQNIARLINAQFDFGQIKKTELLSYQADLLMAEYNKEKAQNDLKIKEMLFEQFFGIRPKSEMILPSDHTRSLPKSFNDLLALALKNNPNLKAQNSALQAKKASLALSIANRSPSLNYELSKDIAKSDQKTSTEMSVTLPIISGEGLLDIPLKKHEVREASINKMHANDSIKAEVSNLWQNHQIAKIQISTIKKALEARSLALQAVTQEYKLGKSILVNVQKAEQELQKSKTEQVAVESNFIKTSYQIIAMCGALNKYICDPLENTKIKQPRISKPVKHKQTKGKSYTKIQTTKKI